MKSQHNETTNHKVRLKSGSTRDTCVGVSLAEGVIRTSVTPWSYCENRSHTGKSLTMGSVHGDKCMYNFNIDNTNLQREAVLNSLFCGGVCTGGAAGCGGTVGTTPPPACIAATVKREFILQIIYWRIH